MLNNEKDADEYERPEAIALSDGASVKSVGFAHGSVDSPAPDPTDDDTGLVRTMGPWSGIALVCGLMVGSGIFSTPATVLVHAGSAGMAMVIWGIGALVTLCGALSYTELGSMLPQSGGEQAYLDYAFRKPRALLAFLFCFCMIVCIRPGSAAANSTVFGKYILYAAYGPRSDITNTYIADNFDWLARALAILCLSSIAILNCLSVKWSLWVHNTLTWIKLLTLLLISITGLVIVSGVTNVQRSSLLSEGFQHTSGDLNYTAKGLFAALWAYDGWNNLNYSLGELKRPRRNLPICVVGGVSLITVLYLLTNVAYFSVISMADAEDAREVLAGRWGDLVFGTTFGRIVIPLAIAVSCLGSVSAMTFTVARIILVAAQNQYMPFSDRLAQLHPRFKTPMYCVVIQWVLAMIYLLAPPPGEVFEFLVDMQSYPTWLFYGLSLVGLIWLRRREPLMERPFKVWLLMPAIFILATAFLCIFPFVPPSAADASDTGVPYFLSSLLGALYVLLGIPVWYFLVYKKNRSSTESSSDLASDKSYDAAITKLVDDTNKEDPMLVVKE
ncbi:hypothetical protein H4R34_003023 [Dimargaris verticillata]|uniref:Amino acid/polyamine transporter I n=1 Tax=Dimargaris verticillata TaxID=2761393 RepID=A0A9W8E8N3_9FUNG|nr:hypothetical protein H4R34_003023 [Dimargaris verticillata]